MMTESHSANYSAGDRPPVPGAAAETDPANLHAKAAPISPPIQEPPEQLPPVHEPPHTQPPVQRAKRGAVPKAILLPRPSSLPVSKWRERLREAGSWLSSAALHTLVLIAAALWITVEPPRPEIAVFSARMADPIASPRDFATVLAVPDADISQEYSPFEPIDVTMSIQAASHSSSGEPPPRAENDFKYVEQITRTGIKLADGGQVQGALRGRGPDQRPRLGALHGASKASESAVEKGLRWLSLHQREDGGWRFNHQQGLCEGQCRHPGTAAQTTAATGIALLAFLGAGHTHVHGDYQHEVRKGLAFLRKRMLSTPNGGDLREGTMYAQGIATIALCEAYGMTQDTELKDAASRAVQFILYAQHPQGGWRYNPGQPGDTTVTGWQLMALKSAQMAYLPVPPPALASAGRFLDSVQADGGAYYGYQMPGKEPTNTAIGLLCRMYLGWERDHPGLVQGSRYLYATGPSPDNMYYNYYATQVMFHQGGDAWNSWNLRMRDKLVREQATEGHEAGSWYYPGGKLESGGRLLSTALAVMTLEVYYRYLPLYKSDVLEAGF